MVKARFEITEDGKSIVLNVKGHAESGEIGHDIVCASVSILTYTVGQIVKDMQTQGRLKKKPTIRLDSGDACITCKPNRAFFDEALMAFSVAQVGFNLLSHNYPNFVELTPFGKA